MADKRGSKKAPELSLEVQAANVAEDAGQEKERRALQANAEKQRRFRENMKAAGLRQVLLWDFPCPADVREQMATAGLRQAPAWEPVPPPGEQEQPLPAGTVKVAARIRESSLGIADRSPEIRRALFAALGAFLREADKLPRSAWGAAYNDMRELLRPLGEIERVTE